MWHQHAYFATCVTVTRSAIMAQSVQWGHVNLRYREWHQTHGSDQDLHRYKVTVSRYNAAVAMLTHAGVLQYVVQLIPHALIWRLVRELSGAETPSVVGADFESVLALNFGGDLFLGHLTGVGLNLNTILANDGGDVDGLSEVAFDAARLESDGYGYDQLMK